MTKLKVLGVAVALAVAGGAWAANVRDEPIKPIQAAQVSDAGKVELGKKLWFEPRLSMSGIISCNTCHNLSMGGTDNLKTSIGHGWKAGPVNSPTVFNSSLAIAQFWDGRAADLKEQAGGPIQADVEMNMPHTLAVGILQSIPGYVDEFKRVYGKDKIDIDMITDSIAEFEKTLVTPNARFDKWLAGDDKALTEKELAGYTLRAAAWPATTGRRRAAPPSSAWAWSSRTRLRRRLKGARRSPASMPTASTSRCRPCATSS